MSKENWDDKNFVLEQVQKDSYALKYASDRLKDDVPFCIECAKIDFYCILSFNPEIAELFEKYDNNVDIVEKIYILKQITLYQQQANELFLKKITEKKPISQDIFKRNLLNF